MATQSFDPFSSRLSRDIRNNLSHAFVHSLELMDLRHLRQSAAELLARDLAPVQHRYIRDRLKRYEQAYTEILENGLADPLRQALVIWNEELFFEVHERLEPVWQSATGEKRQALKGLIKAAASYVHMEHGNQKAAKNLAAKAATLLNQHGKSLNLCLNLGKLLQKLGKVGSIPVKFQISQSDKP